MKISRFAVMIVLIGGMMSSCSVLNKQQKTISGSDAIRIDREDAAVATPAPVPVDVPGQDEPAVSPAISDMKNKTSDIEERLGGEWTIVQVGSRIIDSDDNMPYVIFEPSKAQFYASNGCNTINGTYSVDSLQRLVFRNVLSTLRLCPDVPFESGINAVISDKPAPFKISEIGSESFLDFIDGNGMTLMRMRRGNLGFLNGQWDVESIAGLKEMESPASVFFDLTELKLHGNTGCNIVNGDIYLDHRRPNSVDFSNMIVTQMACPFEAQQTAMLVALEECASALNDGADKVMLLNSDGKILITLKKAEQNIE